MWTESSSVAEGSPCCHCRPSRSCSMRLATGSEQRWSPRCWGGRCQGARFDSVALLRYAIRVQGQRMITPMLCWSDGDGKVIEGDAEPEAGVDPRDEHFRGQARALT